jgi:hypothetical protein
MRAPCRGCRCRSPTAVPLEWRLLSAARVHSAPRPYSACGEERQAERGHVTYEAPEYAYREGDEVCASDAERPLLLEFLCPAHPTPSTSQYVPLLHPPHAVRSLAPMSVPRVCSARARVRLR